MAVYRRGVGKVWWYEFHFQGRRIRESSGFTNKTAALHVEAKRKADLLDRRAGFTKAKLAPKFEEFVKKFLAWCKQQQLAQSTCDLHKTNTDTLLRFFSGYWLDEVTAAMVEDFKSARLGEKRRNAKKGGAVSPATVNRCLTTLKKLYGYAEQLGYVPSNPARRVKSLKEGSGRTRVVSFDEELAYLAKASQPLRDIAQVILDTGLRPGEAYRARIEDLDFGRHTIFIPRGKTAAARRSVTMSDVVASLLKKYVAKAEKLGSPYIFPSPRNPLAPIGSVRKAHNAAVKNAGIKEHFKLHDLRHTFATHTATGSGVDLPTLASMLGHTKIQMTMRYVHPAEEQKRMAAGKLEIFRIEGLQHAVAKALEKSRAAVPTKVPTSERVN